MGVGLYSVVYHLLLLLLLLVQAHSKCQKSYTCRNLTLEFPFTNTDNPECGLFTVDGCDNPLLEHPILRMGASTRPKYIIGQRSGNRFLILDFELRKLLDPSRKCYTFANLSLPQSPSVSLAFSPNITFFRCLNRTANNRIEDYFKNYSRESCEASTVYYKIPATHDRAPAIPGECALIQLPMNKSRESSTKLLEVLTPSFELEWNVSEACSECFHGGGQCLADAENKFYCKTGIAYALIAEYLIPRNQF